MYKQYGHEYLLIVTLLSIVVTATNYAQYQNEKKPDQQLGIPIDRPIETAFTIPQTNNKESIIKIHQPIIHNTDNIKIQNFDNEIKGSKHEPILILPKVVIENEINSRDIKTFLENDEIEVTDTRVKEIIESSADIESVSNDFQIQIDPRRVISIMIYSFMIVNGIYICFYGFRLLRITITILGFIVGYYTPLFIAISMKIYTVNSVTHQILIFIICIILGFATSIGTYKIKALNNIILGISISCALTLIYGQFFVDFTISKNCIFFLLFFILMSAILIVTAFFILDSMVIPGTAFLGSTLVIINLGVTTGNLSTLEDRKKFKSRFLIESCVFLGILGFMFGFTTVIQYYMRFRINKTSKVRRLAGFRESHLEA